jgi:hypothetical protein
VSLADTQAAVLLSATPVVRCSFRLREGAAPDREIEVAHGISIRDFFKPQCRRFQARRQRCRMRSGSVAFMVRLRIVCGEFPVECSSPLARTTRVARIRNRRHYRWQEGNSGIELRPSRNSRIVGVIDFKHGLPAMSLDAVDPSARPTIGETLTR